VAAGPRAGWNVCFSRTHDDIIAVERFAFQKDRLQKELATALEQRDVAKAELKKCSSELAASLATSDAHEIVDQLKGELSVAHRSTASLMF